LAVAFWIVIIYNPATLSSGFFIGKIMWQDLLNTFKKPNAKQLAQQELEEAQRQFLKHETAAAYNAKVAEYYSETVLRLNTYIKKSV
jgi:hypothetical protein